MERYKSHTFQNAVFDFFGKSDAMLKSLNKKHNNKYIRILGFAKSLYSVDRYTFANEHRSGFYEYDSEYGYYEWSGVTHWMPLPEPPKESADNG